jgi:hypothetical protein
MWQEIPVQEGGKRLHKGLSKIKAWKNTETGAEVWLVLHILREKSEPGKEVIFTRHCYLVYGKPEKGRMENTPPESFMREILLPALRTAAMIKSIIES